MTELPINQVLCGDAAELMRGLPSNSIHAIVTDPPYGLEFMGSEWDQFKVKDYGISGFLGESLTKQEMLNYQQWTTAWAREALRVLLPGASMMVMGGTRTYHRMACGVEDAGFEVKDTILWCYNSGFPKAQDLGKMIDRRLGAEREVVGKGKYFDRQPQGCQGDVTDYTKSKGERWGENALITAPATPLAREWDGWKVGGLKPSYEPVVWAVKPPEGSTTDNVLKHKVGAINVDACRIPRSRDDRFEYGVSGNEPSTPGKNCYGDWGRHTYEPDDKGRYPVNMVRTDRFEDGYDRFYFVPKADRGERDEGLDGVNPEGPRPLGISQWEKQTSGSGKTMGLSSPARNVHPTVKPIALMEYLIKLVTRPDQVVLDPFVGSGTTCIAARKLLRRYVGIDNNAEYCEIAKKRLAAIPPPLEVFA